MAKAKTEEQKRRYWFAEKPKTSNRTFKDRNRILLQWLIGRMGKDALIAAVNDIEDPFGNDEIVTQMYSSYSVKCKNQLPEYKR